MRRQSDAFDSGLRIVFEKVPCIATWRNAKVQTCRIWLQWVRDSEGTRGTQLLSNPYVDIPKNLLLALIVIGAISSLTKCLKVLVAFSIVPTL